MSCLKRQHIEIDITVRQRAFKGKHDRYNVAAYQRDNGIRINVRLNVIINKGNSDRGIHPDILRLSRR